MIRTISQKLLTLLCLAIILTAAGGFLHAWHLRIVTPVCTSSCPDHHHHPVHDGDHCFICLQLVFLKALADNPPAPPLHPQRVVYIMLAGPELLCLDHEHLPVLGPRPPPFFS